jgi:signal transduction histidine kinase
MSQKSSLFKGISQSTPRQWRSSPTYFFLIWRWGTWLLALIWTLAIPDKAADPATLLILYICLAITFIYTLAVTLYIPVSHALTRKPASAHKTRAARKKNPRLPGAQRAPSILRPLLDTHNTYGNIAIYVLDVVICGLITYFSAANGGTPFGSSSPFYRYGLSAVLVAGFTYSYPGGLLAALGYNLFVILGAFVYPPTQTIVYQRIHLGVDLTGSLIDAPLIALLAAYMASQLNRAIHSKREEQERARRERFLREVSEGLVAEASDQLQLLRQSVKAIRQGGHFEKLVIALIRHEKNQEPRPDFETCAETDISAQDHPDVSAELISLVAKTGQRYLSFDSPSIAANGSKYAIARLYQPFFKDEQIYLVIGAESTRYTSFDQRQEEFLAAVGPQLVIALENVRLTGETAELATLAERGRIAREIHDGIAQLLYMLSLNSETCLALVERANGEPEEKKKVDLSTISRYLEKQVMISKQALWETRHYMFTLRPLMSGDTTLTQLIVNQLREFETISGLPAHLVVEGKEELFNSDQQGNQRKMQAAMALFRISQEALTNTYKHAEATQLEIRLSHEVGRITVEISDNGRGIDLPVNALDNEHIYSGHGLQGMYERAAELNGQVEISANSAGGTRVVASIPIR